MDKVKIALAVLKKYHFWVLCGLMILISFGVSVMATSDLDTQLADGIQTLESSFRSVESISNTSPHPNQKMIDGINSRTEILKQDVFEAWTTLYDEQDEKNQLDAALTDDDDFKREFDQKDRDISWQNLTLYQTFIRGRFEMLFNDVLNVHRKDASDNGAGPDEPDEAPPGTPARMTGGNENANRTENMIGIVKWDNHPAVKAQYDWPKRPTTERVRTAQENLWVYEALFRVIRDTNSDPDATEPIGRHNAAVIEIQSLEIGVGDSATTVGGSADGSTTKPRYVDQNGQPLAADAPRPAEYNIMPIRMLLSIDQTKIPKLLVECANSNMPIEVRSVRIRPGEGQTLNLGAIDSMGPSPKSNRRPAGEAVTGATYIPVEIQGLIYIYNPPDPMTLGTGALAESPNTTTEPAASESADALRD